MIKTASLLVMIIAFSTLAHGGVADFFADREQVDAMYLKASLYEQDGELEEAAKMLETVVETVNEEYVYLKLASLYERLNDGEMLKYTLERAVRKLPSSYALKGALAEVYRQAPETVEKAYAIFREAYEKTGDAFYAEEEAKTYRLNKEYNSAIQVYTNLLKREKKSEYYVERARNYESLGLKNEALSDYHKAAELDENFLALAKVADYYLDKGDDDKAIEYLRRVISVSPNMTLAKFRLAVLLGKVGQSEESEKLFVAILEYLNDDEKVYVYKQLAKMAFENNEREKAEEYFTRAFEIDQDVQTAYSLAILAESSKKFTIAEGWYRDILVKRPDFVEARKRLAILLLRMDEPGLALETLHEEKIDFKDVDFYRIEAQGYTDLKDYASAEKVLREALNVNPGEVKLYIDLALAVDRQGDKLAAETAIKDGMRYYPDDAALLNFLGYLYAEQGKHLDEAEDMIRKALEEKPEEAAYLDSMAWVYYQKGEYQDAYEYQIKAARKAPDEQEIIDHLKAIMEKLGIEKSVEDVIKGN